MKTKICGLTKKFGGKTALDSIECELNGGELIALAGTNGAGKTTLMKTLATLYVPGDGGILLDGELLTRDRIDLRARLHFLSDSPFFLRGTAIDHICMAAHLYQRPLTGLKAKIIGWLKQFDLLESAEKPIEKLSRGQKYKASFIGLLAADPELWLLDEPFGAGVDPPGISAMKRCISKAVGSGRTVVYSTQIVELAENFSDRVLILHRAKLKVDITTRELTNTAHIQGLAHLFENLGQCK